MGDKYIETSDKIKIIDVFISLFIPKNLTKNIKFSIKYTYKTMGSASFTYQKQLENPCFCV